MGLKIIPAYAIKANSADVTKTIAERFKNLRLTDEAGTTADTLELTLSDHDSAKPIKIPTDGAELEVSIGYEGELRAMGLFIVDEVELSGPPDELVIRARAAPYEKSKGGKSQLQSQKSRSWKKGTTIRALVEKIAGEHGMKAAVASELGAIKLPHVDQSHESDMNLLHRLAKVYDAIAKPAGGRLLFVKRGDGKTASGASLPRITLTREQTSSHRLSLAKREGAGTVVAYYRDRRASERREVSVGDGDPVKRLRMQYKDAESATAAANAEQRKRARAGAALSVTCPGDPSIVAEAPLTLAAGFREGVAGDYVITRAEHYIGPQGYRTTIEAELPNSDASVTKSTAKTEDRKQAGTEVEA